MSKDLDEELFDKYSNLVLYANKLNILKNVTKGHKQRFINMVLELLKFRGKNLDAQIWIYYTLVYYQKYINKYKKTVDTPVALKLEQQIKEIICSNPYNIEFKHIENKNNENLNNNIIKNENKIKNGKSKEKSDGDKNKENIIDSKNTNTKDANTINIEDNENKIKKKMSQLLDKINKYNSLKEFIINSISKENKSNKIFCEVYPLLHNFNLALLPYDSTEGNININIRKNLLHLITLIFPFISYKQKSQIAQMMQDQFESDAIKILKDSKFISMSKKNNIFEFLISSIINKNISEINLNTIFKRKLLINKLDDIFDLYKIYILINIFEFNDYKEYIYHIAFKIKFFLENYEDLYQDDKDWAYIKIYFILSRLKKFYIKGYNNKFTGDDLEDENSEDLTYDLFSNDENNIYCELYKRINKFYYIRKNLDLVSGYAKELKNFEFPFNIIELISIKNDLIKNNFQKFKQILISIEKQIYRMGYESLFPNSSTNLSSFFSSNQKKKIISNYESNVYLRQVFFSLKTFLEKKLSNYNFKLYPYGSSTEFLSDRDSDIDLYLDISQIETKKQKLDFLYDLIHFIKYFDKSVNSTISTRVCVITFTYKKINFDISIVGFCPYLHSLLIREYSLIDPRFPLLLISIKHLIKYLRINNISDDRNHCFLNSFSWSLLLIGFLQDIVQPPVLPKILSNSKSFITKAFFGNNKIEKEEEEKNSEKNSENKFEKVLKLKNFESFINNIQINDVEIPQGLGDANIRKDLYQKLIKEKNNMTCSELLLKFLEFVIFYFKYDTLFIDNSFTYEGFRSIDAINYFNSDEDSKFLHYFKTKYIRRVKEDKGRDGYFLLRDPFDSRYNPGQTLKANSLKKFFSRLKFAYYHLLKYGEFSLIKKKIDIEEERAKKNKV